MTMTRRTNFATPPKLKKGDSDDEGDVNVRRIIVMQQTIDNLKSKIAAQDMELMSLRGVVKHLQEDLDPYARGLEVRFGERIQGVEEVIDMKNKEVMARMEQLAREVELQMMAIKDHADRLAHAVEKNARELANAENGQTSLKKDVSDTLESLKEMKHLSLSYKDAMKASTGHGAPAAPANPPATRCIVKAPRGHFQGKTSQQLAQDYNKKVVSNLTRLEGHITLPEAVGMVRLQPREGANLDMWLLYFPNAADVSKMFAYKPQLKTVCPSVFIQPDLPKEVRTQRGLLYREAKRFVETQAVPNAWRFKWIESLKMVISGPSDAKRYVIIENGAAKVVMEGKVKVVFVKNGKAKGAEESK